MEIDKLNVMSNNQSSQVSKNITIVKPQMERIFSLTDGIDGTALFMQTDQAICAVKNLLI